MNSEEYDFWLLDLDGTLVDIERPYIYDVFDGVGERLDTSFTDREAELVWYGIGDARNEVLEQKGVDLPRFWDVFHASPLTPGHRRLVRYCRLLY